MKPRECQILPSWMVSRSHNTEAGLVGFPGFKHACICHNFLSLFPLPPERVPSGGLHGEIPLLSGTGSELEVSEKGLSSTNTVD